MDTRQIICCLRDVGSFLGFYASDMLPKFPITSYGTLIVNTDPHTATGSHWLAIHIQSRSSVFIISTSMVYLHIFLPYNHSSTETALSGITTRYSYKALRQMPVANIAVSGRCTWIGVTRLKNSLCTLLTPFNQINGCPNYLRRSLAHYPEYCRETGNVTLV
jgi:hypothetical protein